MCECSESKQPGKREGGFDRTNIVAERFEDTLRRLHAGLVWNLLLLDYTMLDGRSPLKNSLWA